MSTERPWQNGSAAAGNLPQMISNSFWTILGLTGDREMVTITGQWSVQMVRVRLVTSSRSLRIKLWCHATQAFLGSLVSGSLGTWRLSSLFWFWICFLQPNRTVRQQRDSAPPNSSPRSTIRPPHLDNYTRLPLAEDFSGKPRGKLQRCPIESVNTWDLFLSDSDRYGGLVVDSS